ncbi:HesB/YadR/YfhF family protein [Evansella sp. AB-rgal1]|uniref:HesB/YadR/YfhF family protein n=1 Tax=Evansella sp. AB-rgal1 TaxID=3242696 RepID=UPI00359DAC5C
MNVMITEKAVDFYKKEMMLKENEEVTLYVRVGGIGSGGFSVGIRKGTPDLDFIKITQSNIPFCIAKEEKWYFDGMKIDYNRDMGEMVFLNDRIDDLANPDPN